MVKQSAVDDGSSPGPFDDFATSLFRFTRTLRSTQGLWVQLPGRLKRSDVTILRVLSERGECRPGFIADELGIGASAVSRQLVPLEEDRLVARRRDPEDGRAELVSLTPVGRSRLTTLRTAYISGMQAQFADWDDDQVYAAAALLDQISDHLAPALGRPQKGSDA
ncbi:MarR family transcriptional regulator [Nocardioides sp. AE5]|uniref:MarR family winged helix-turn-helix transcriptional regulator n=1 Tax=Nocardioides sp. AE5 TaxID=2962573 RepID=UPI0028811E7B|nr:MarR family transcriptional regulator [Nocardioides sp. AE5]MDT0202072.1 MarR family transcriptional regulator [Nocardioides sp. AE5]